MKKLDIWQHDSFSNYLILGISKIKIHGKLNYVCDCLSFCNKIMKYFISRIC